MQGTFYWHDYETFGADPSRDRPVQFAGLRTDADLNIVGDPLVIFSQPARDVLPQPEACLVTGITPQRALAEGMPEAQFIRLIHAELAQMGTCGVGYNSLRFDDEVTRYTLYRNFYDPYAREWQNGNSRWDIIDMVRAAYALRPDGIEWPQTDEGLPSFKLELLTAANGIEHGAAHDALSDVTATIALARLIRERQPRLFDYLLEHRGKRALEPLLDIANMKPVLHVSGMFGAARFNIGLIVPLARHPENANEVICYDLSIDPSDLLSLDAQQIRERLFASRDDLPEWVARPALKTVRLNRCPVLVTPKMLNPATAERVGIDGDACRKHLAALRDAPGLAARVQAVYAQRDREPITDPDRMLYSGGFFCEADRRTMEAVRKTGPEALAEQSFVFEDARLPEMLFRYRARNYPETLSDDEQAQWEEYRFQYLTEPEAGGSIALEQFQQRIEALLAEEGRSPRDREILEQLLDYGDQLLAG